MRERESALTYWSRDGEDWLKSVLPGIESFSAAKILEFLVICDYSER